VRRVPRDRLNPAECERLPCRYSDEVTEHSRRSRTPRMRVCRGCSASANRHERRTSHSLLAAADTRRQRTELDGYPRCDWRTAAAAERTEIYGRAAILISTMHTRLPLGCAVPISVENSPDSLRPSFESLIAQPRGSRDGSWASADTAGTVIPPGTMAAKICFTCSVRKQQSRSLLTS
jgi:hypothetical protein